MPPAPDVFTGRQSELAKIGDVLNLKQRVALVGMPGVGKSATARQWAEENKDKYRYGFHIIADTEANTRAGYHKAAQVLQLPGVTVKEEAAGVQGFLKWLNVTPDALLILDNADDIDQWKELLPQKGKAQILLTARPDTFKPVVETVRVKTMMDETGAECLLQWAGVDAPSDKEKADARELSRELGGLPLALRQAGGFCLANGSSFEDYLNLLTAQGGELLGIENAGLSGGEQTVYKTFKIAMDRLGESHPVARQLLILFSFFASGAIPQEIFTDRPDILPQAFAEVFRDAITWSELRGALLRYALLEVDVKNKAISIHRLLQQIIQYALSPEQKVRVVTLQMVLLSEVFPDSEFENWEKCGRMIRHVIAVIGHITAIGYADQSVEFRVFAVRLLGRSAAYFIDLSEFKLAAIHCELALSILDQEDSVDQSVLVALLNNLAMARQGMGQFAQAAELLTEAISIRRLIGSPEEIAIGLNNLAESRRVQGAGLDAVPLYNEALMLLREMPSPNFQFIARTTSNLAMTWENLGKFDKAIALNEEALQTHGIKEYHPVFINGLNNLALSYKKKGDYTTALPLYEEALRLGRTHLPYTHRIFSAIVYNSATCYRALQDYAKALPLMIEALAIAQIILEPTHPYVQHMIEEAFGFIFEMTVYESRLTIEEVHSLSKSARDEIFDGPIGSFVTSVNDLKERIQQGQRT